MPWILNTALPWRDSPERYDPWQTAHNRFNRWQNDSTFDAILERSQIRLDEDGRIDWTLRMVDGSTVRAHVAAAGAEDNGGLTNPTTTHWIARETG